MNIKKYDLKINEDIVNDLKSYFNGNKAMDGFEISLDIEINRNLSIKINLKDIGSNENRALEFILDSGFAKYINIFTSFYDLFNLIEIRREKETVIFKPILTNEINYEYMIKRAKALDELKESENLFTNVIMTNNFSNELELYETLYLFLIIQKNIKKSNIELLKEKLAYYGYDEDNIDTKEEEIMNLALLSKRSWK